MKIINDPIHGHIELSDICIQVIDTPQFQRLRDLKQLGVAYYVFPGASHNRFEHSIGVCHLARTFIEHLASIQPELEITSRDIKCVELAGLCHDLGHGPFSHLFDNGFMPVARPEAHFDHETMSQKLFDLLVLENGIKLNFSEAEFIKDLIHGEPRSELTKREKRFLFEIVANKRNSVDVDKFDYIERDCYNIGMKGSVDSRRLIKFARVIDDQICFDQKEAYNLYELFHTRYSLFKRVYGHRVNSAIQYMIIDMLLTADPVLHISACVEDLNLYTNLTDSIMNEIAKSKSPALAKSKEILKRVQKRDLYKFTDQVIIPSDLLEEITHEHITSKKIAEHKAPDESLDPEDIIVEWMKLNYAFKDKNPVDSIRFFNKRNNLETCSIAKECVSLFIPSQYKEVTVRVYSKNRRDSPAIQFAFRSLLEELNSNFSSITPLLAHSMEIPENIRVNELNPSSRSNSRSNSPTKSRLVANRGLTLESPSRTINEPKKIKRDLDYIESPPSKIKH